MSDFCEICKNKTSNCKYNPRKLFFELQKTLDDFEFYNLNCPADFVVFSDIHEEFIALRNSISEALSAYEEK